MGVFISWAGQPSRELAVAFRQFLRVVVQRSAPWMSDRDIAAGQPWDAEIETNLKAARFGVACVTPDNLSSTYLHYEVGAIANQVGQANRVCPLLLGLAAVGVPQPLGRFQAKVVTNKDEVFDLVRSINDSMPDPG